MGHSSVNVSLTYLRGLEVPQLSEEDMPTIGKKKPYFKGITNVAKKRII